MPPPTHNPVPYDTLLEYRPLNAPTRASLGGRAMVLARLRSLIRSWKEVRDLTRESPERLQALIKLNETAAAASEQRLTSMQQSLARPLEQVANPNQAVQSSEIVAARRHGSPAGLLVVRCPASTGSSPPYTVTRASAANAHTHANAPRIHSNTANAPPTG